MDQQDQRSETPNALGDAGELAQGQLQAEDSSADSAWGVGSASAMEHLRRHDYRARRSKTPELDERPQSE